MSGNDTHADTIRAALKSNGVFRYGEYERSNTRPALAALDALVAEVERERARADRAEYLLGRASMRLLSLSEEIEDALLSAGSGGH